MYAYESGSTNPQSRCLARTRLVAASIAACLLTAIAASPALSQDEQDNDASDAAPKRAFVRMETSKGDIWLELNAEKAPITVENFLQYVEDEFYDGTIFHRVIPSFMIQGGGFTDRMVQKATRDSIKNEWENGLKNVRGSIAMARLGGQADSATSQFFINVADNPALDQARDGAAYAVFGKVVAGMDIVDKIRQVATHTVNRHQNVPVEPVVIRRVRRISAEDAQKAIDAEKHEEGDAAEDSTEDGDGDRDR